MSAHCDPVRAKSDLTVTLACNNRCPFCPRSTLAHIRVKSEREIDERLRAIRAGSSRVVLTGGEVTIHPDFARLVRSCRELGFEQIGVITNGRRFADRDFAREIVGAGLSEVCVSVYDLRPAVHDALTATPGSLAETLAGLDNLLSLANERRGLGIRVNTLLGEANADGLHALLLELVSRGVPRILVAEVMLSSAFDAPLEHGRVREIARAVTADARLAQATIHWRGWPICLLSGIPGIRVEGHEIDTAIIDAEEREPYFEEFYQSFAKVEACAACSERSHCPGLQKRYLERFGSEHVTPLDRTSELEAARRELAEFPAWPESGRLEVVVTTACPLRCQYCAVTIRPRHARPEVLDRAVDLLLTSRQARLELQFFGGEPLLRPSEVRRTMSRAAVLARNAGKDLRFSITTNGLFLDQGLLEFLGQFPVKVMFSFDGPPEVMAQYRPAARANIDACSLIEENLRRLLRSGLDHFVNMVITPDAVGDLPRRLRYVMDLGARSIQICYALGPGWTDAAREAFCAALRECSAIASSDPRREVRLQNVGSAAEPTVLSNDLIVDVDGTLYSDAAIFGERVLPGSRAALRIGNVFELGSFDGLRRTREQNLVTLRATYPEGSEPRKIVEQQLELGRHVQQTLDALAREARGRDANPLQKLVLRRSLAEQAEFSGRRPDVLALPILMLENACHHACLFCLPKPLAPTRFEQVSEWLDENRRLGLQRLGLAGNEPLAHPEIFRIIEQARSVGFTRFDVLGSGAPLADAARARRLFELGVTGYALPLYAADPTLHDAITQTPGSFADTKNAIEVLRALGAEIHVHTNLLRQNLDALEELEALVVRDWGLPFCVLPVRAKSAVMPYGELAPRYSEIVARARVRGLVAFPLCVAGQLQDPRIPNGSIVSDVLKLYVLDQPFVKPPKCRGCRWYSRCSGTFQAYLDLHGDRELNPA